MNVLKSFWLDGVLVVALINRMPSNLLGGKNLLEVPCPSATLFPIPLKVFGYRCFVHSAKQQRGKTRPKTTKCIILEYPSSHKVYKCNLFGKKIAEHTMDGTFDEDIPYYAPESKELIHEESKGVSLSLIQSMPLSSY